MAKEQQHMYDYGKRTTTAPDKGFKPGDLFKSSYFLSKGKVGLVLCLANSPESPVENKNFKYPDSRSVIGRLVWAVLIEEEMCCYSETHMERV